MKLQCTFSGMDCPDRFLSWVRSPPPPPLLSFAGAAPWDGRSTEWARPERWSRNMTTPSQARSLSSSFSLLSYSPHVLCAIITSAHDFSVDSKRAVAFCQQYAPRETFSHKKRKHTQAQATVADRSPVLACNGTCLRSPN